MKHRKDTHECMRKLANFEHFLSVVFTMAEVTTRMEEVIAEKRK